MDPSPFPGNTCTCAVALGVVIVGWPTEQERMRFHAVVESARSKE